MALTLGGATSNRIDSGSAAMLDDLPQVTVWAWVYATTLTSLRCIMGKNSALALNVATAGANNLRLLRSTSGTNFSYITNDNRLTTNKWWFVAATMDFGAGAGSGHVYLGDLAALATECTYGTASDGTGSLASDAAGSLHWGNNGAAAPTQSWQGHLACAGLINRVLTLAEITSIQRQPRAVPGTLDYKIFGYTGTGAQLDYSGNGNSGTITGATLAAVHLPLRRWRRQGGAAQASAGATVYQVTLGGGVTPTGTLRREVAKVLAGGITPAGALQRQARKLLSGGATPAGALQRQARKLLSGGATPAGALSTLKVVIKSLGGGITPTGALARAVTKVLGGGVTPAGGLVRALTKRLAAGVTPVGAPVRQVRRLLAGALAPTGGLVPTFVAGVAATLLKLTAGLGRVLSARLTERVGGTMAAGVRVVQRVRARIVGSPSDGPEA